MGEEASISWRILIIDDDPDFCLLLRTALPKEIAVETCSSGEEGLEAAKYGKFDMILIDVMMPGIHGFHTLEVLRQDAKLTTVPLLVTSNLARDEVEVKAAEAGAGYIDKQIPIKEIVARIHQTLLAK